MHQPGSIVLISDISLAAATAVNLDEPICTVKIARLVHAAPGYGVFYFTEEGNYILITSDIEGKERVIFMVRPEDVLKLQKLEKDKGNIVSLDKYFNFEENSQ